MKHSWYPKVAPMMMIQATCPLQRCSCFTAYTQEVKDVMGHNRKDYGSQSKGLCDIIKRIVGHCKKKAVNKNVRHC